MTDEVLSDEDVAVLQLAAEIAPYSCFKRILSKSVPANDTVSSQDASPEAKENADL